MFADYVFEMSSAQYSDKILLIDDENLNSRTDYAAAFSAHGFETVHYVDDLDFGLNYEAKLKAAGFKLAAFAKSDAYVPWFLQWCQQLLLFPASAYCRINIRVS